METDDVNHGYAEAVTRDLNLHETNWDTPNAVGCTGCESVVGVAYPPTVGSYSSTLAHYERALGGALPRLDTWKGERSIRLLVLFQDPRPSHRFQVAPPAQDVAELGTDHRYFLLTPEAWRSVRLDESVGPVPEWPRERNAHLYLRRYLGRGPGGRGWAYDGFIAYFLWLLQPRAAYVTNIAKCHFGDDKHQPWGVFDTCARRHLRREVEAVRPDLVLSFTQHVSTPEDLLGLTGAREAPRVVLRVIHPGAPMDAERKIDRFEREVASNRDALGELGYAVDNIRDTWRQHTTRARAR